MPDSAETPSNSPEVPRKGEHFIVLDTPEIRAADGLATHDVVREGGEVRSGTKHMEDKIVRLPIGSTVEVKEVFVDRSGVWIIFDYKYQNPIQGEKNLTLCAMVETRGSFNRTRYLEKTEKVSSAAEALKALRDEIMGGGAAA
jgi:hypothetical protein